MGYTKYFNVNGFFMNLEYLQKRGFNLSAGQVAGSKLSQLDAQRLQDAMKRADADAAKGNLAGIAQFIELVDRLQDIYGVPEKFHQEHRKWPFDYDELIRTVRENSALAKHYGLEDMMSTPQTAVREVARGERRTRTA